MTGPAAENLRVEVVRSPERLALVAQSWDRLWRASGGGLFQSHAWVTAGWRAGSGRARPRLHAGLLWDGDVLLAALPLVVTRRRALRVLEWAGKEHTDYCDALVVPGADAAAHVARLWSGLATAGGFDLAYLSHLRPDSAAAGLAGATRAGPVLLAVGRRRETNLRVRGSWPGGDAWLDSLPKKPRQNYKRGWKTLREAGPATFRLVGPDEADGPILDRLVALKRDWLARTGQSSTLLDGDARALKACVEAMRAAGVLRIFLVELDGVVVAGSVNFVEGTRMAAFFAAYDPVHERASLGMLLMADYMRWSFDRGLDEIDFLCGAEDYKLRYANTRIELRSLVGARTLAGRAALWLDRLGAEDAGWRRPLARLCGRPAAPAGAVPQLRRG